MALSAGTRLGSYEIVALLGSGGMGEVYKARDTRLDRLVAIKILHAERSGDENRKRRFEQEARAASGLNHPNIVTIYDVGEAEPGVDYLVMELVPGKSLDQVIPRSGMRLSEILRSAVQMADALSKAHAAGIVHRDLKPGNVMLTPEGQVKILDFGLAKLTQIPGSDDTTTKTIGAHTEEGTVVGTTSYMSPEQAEGRPVDARSDIFSFGAMLYEMTTGERAFRGETQMSIISAVLRDDPKALEQLRQDVPPQLARAINRCLRKDPARRYQYMADLKVELEDIKEESDSGKLAARPGTITPKPRRIAGWAVAGFTLVAAGVLAARFFAVQPAPEIPLQPIPLTSYPGDEFAPHSHRMEIK